MTEEKIGTLEEEALRRKERLKQLKKKQDAGELESSHKEPGNIPKPVFRNYHPNDDVLKTTVKDPVKPGSVEDHIQEQLEAAKTRVVIEELDITTLAPRKPDWDLKRDVAKKLERLEKRTQKAIAELIRERLKTEAGDLATKVSLGAQSHQVDEGDD